MRAYLQTNSYFVYFFYLNWNVCSCPLIISIISPCMRRNVLIFGCLLRLAATSLAMSRSITLSTNSWTLLSIFNVFWLLRYLESWNLHILSMQLTQESSYLNDLMYSFSKVTIFLPCFSSSSFFTLAVSATSNSLIWTKTSESSSIETLVRNLSERGRRYSMYRAFR